VLVSIALTAATLCMVAPAQNVLTRRNGPRPETRPTGPRSRHWGFCSRRDVSTSWDRLEVETSRPRLHPWHSCWFGLNY